MSPQERHTIQGRDVIVLRYRNDSERPDQDVMKALAIETGAVILTLPVGQPLEHLTEADMRAAGWIPAMDRTAVLGVPEPAHLNSAPGSPPEGPIPPEAR